MTNDEQQTTTGALSVYDPYYEAGSRLLTWETIKGEAVFTGTAAPHLLQLAWEDAARRTRIEVVAYAVLPDHVHLLLVPSTATNWERFTRAAQSDFDAAYQAVQGLPEPVLVWKVGYRMQQIDDERKFAACIDRIHYDPVHHGLVERPEEWLYSSYERWIERGVYRLGWGWERPQRLIEV